MTTKNQSILNEYLKSKPELLASINSLVDELNSLLIESDYQHWLISHVVSPLAFPLVTLSYKGSFVSCHDILNDPDTVSFVSCVFHEIDLVIESCIRYAAIPE